MIGLGIAFAVLIVYLIIRSNRKDVKIEPPVCPKPVTPPPSTPLAHPYQKIIDKAAEDMIKENDKALSEGESTADMTNWKESYQSPIKKEVLKKIRDHYKHYDKYLEFKFSESTFLLRARIVLKDK